jgi:hypothetical protein
MNTNQSTGTISIVNTVGTDMCRYLLTKGRYVLPYCQQVPIWVGIYETPACPKGRYHLPYCQQVPIWVGIYETPACPKRRYHLVNRYRYEGKFMNTIQSRLFKRDDIGGIIEYICIASFATVSTSTEDVRITGTVFGKRRIEQNRPAYGTMTRVFWPLVFFLSINFPRAPDTLFKTPLLNMASNSWRCSTSVADTECFILDPALRIFLSRILRPK